MEVPANYLQLITRSITLTIEMCAKATSPEEKLYYFSAVYGAINRVMNIHCDPVLVFSHHVLQTVHQSLNARLAASRNPNAQPHMSVPEEMIDALLLYLTEFSRALDSKTDSAIWAVLQKFSNLAYATTGNGFYLYITGQLKL
jgi:hypothetical protein